MRVYWLNFPIRNDARSLLMAKASVAATNQGKFRQFHDALFDKQNVHDAAQLMELARAAGIDLPRFSADLEDPRTAQLVANQREFCSSNGAIGTPSFLIDGELVTGAVPFDELAAILDEVRQP